MYKNLIINLYLRVFSVAIHGKFHLCLLYYFSLFLFCALYKSGPEIRHYILEVSRYTNIVYIGDTGVYLVLT